jgi:hypothetical protein
VFGIINQETSTNYNSYSSNNILSLDGDKTTLCTLAIFNMDNKSTIFEINTPIGFYVSGQARDNIDVSGIIRIDTLDISIYNNNNLVKTTNIFTNTSIVDASVNFYTNFPRDGSGNIIGATTFQGVQYIGNLTISNIDICTQPGLLYDIKLVFNIASSFVSGTDFTTGSGSNLKTGVQMNLSPNNYPYSTIRCNFTDIFPTPEPLIGFYVKSTT